jgi:hypothetical protein
LSDAGAAGVAAAPPLPHARTRLPHPNPTIQPGTDRCNFNARKQAQTHAHIHVLGCGSRNLRVVHLVEVHREGDEGPRGGQLGGHTGGQRRIHPAADHRGPAVGVRLRARCRVGGGGGRDDKGGGWGVGGGGEKGGRGAGGVGPRSTMHPRTPARPRKLACTQIRALAGPMKGHTPTSMTVPST